MAPSGGGRRQPERLRGPGWGEGEREDTSTRKCSHSQGSWHGHTLRSLCQGFSLLGERKPCWGQKPHTSSSTGWIAILLTHGIISRVLEGVCVTPGPHECITADVWGPASAVRGTRSPSVLRGPLSSLGTLHEARSSQLCVEGRAESICQGNQIPRLRQIPPMQGFCG